MDKETLINKFKDDCQFEIKRYLAIAESEEEFLTYCLSIQNGWSNRRRDPDFKEVSLVDYYKKLWEDK